MSRTVRGNSHVAKQTKLRCQTKRARNNERAAALRISLKG